MNTATTYRTSSDSLEQTEKLAELVGTRLRGGEVIALSSDLGGGKTAFVRGLARGMGSKNHVASPTFTISREYHADNLEDKISDKKSLTIYHFDFYRLHEPGLMSLELADAMADPHGIVVVEWGDIVESVLPEERIIVQITRTGETSRDFTFEFPEKLRYLIKEDSPE